MAPLPIEAPADARSRGMCAMWCWPCPRTYPANREDRDKLGILKPADWSKDELSEKFRGVLQKRNLLSCLRLGRECGCHVGQG